MRDKILLLGAVVLLGISLAAMNGHGTNEPSLSASLPATTVPPQPATHVYSPLLERAFLAGCGANSACGCMLADFERQYTETQFNAIMHQYSTTNRYPPEMLRVAADCVGP